MTKGIGVCTCVAGNYVAFARVLADSFHRYHPEIPLHVLVADSRVPEDIVKGPAVRVLRLGDLPIRSLWKMLLRYNRKQVLVATKPTLLRYMLETGYETAVYLDADMLVTASLDTVLQEASEHALSLTPHVGPDFAAAERKDLERALLLAGMYNGGFIGVTNREESRRFLEWWEERLRTHCIEAVREGLHYDQRWLDMAPALVSDLCLLRDPGLNVAYWSLPDRDGALVNGAPLRFFHFSGYNPAHPQQVSHYLPNLRVDELGPLADLFHRYAALLREAGWDGTNARPWPWDRRRAVAHCLDRLRKRLNWRSLRSFLARNLLRQPT